MINLTKIKNKNKYQHGSIIYDSKEEVYFLWYLQELEAKGYIEKIEYHPKTYTLREKEYYHWIEELKTKKKDRYGVLLEECTYTYDFHWLWNESVKGIFYENIGSKKRLVYPFIAQRDVSCVDVKGGYSKYNRGSNYREFVVKQKWLRAKYDVLVQPVEPLKLFAKTFTPERFLFTDMAAKKRKINWEARGIEEFTE